jgi:geranylgeranyl diphosphate synthase type II
MNLREYLAQQQQLVDSELDRLVPPESTPPETIHRAMRYSLFAGGKRIRPILCIEAARTITSECSGILATACSLELIHTYSLIHDDLPALDNDDYRRGKLTNHKVFGDAIAILAGDSLLTRAFQVLSQLDAPDHTKTRLIAKLAVAAGTVGGMIGGQVADLEGEGKPPGAELLDTIHRAKTGALLRASLRMGATAAGSSETQYDALSCYGEHVGGLPDRGRYPDIEESLSGGKPRATRPSTRLLSPVYGLDDSGRRRRNASVSAVLAPFAYWAQRLTKADLTSTANHEDTAGPFADRGLAEPREGQAPHLRSARQRTEGGSETRSRTIAPSKCLAATLCEPWRIQTGRGAAPLGSTSPRARSAWISARPPSFTDVLCRPGPPACMPWIAAPDS